MFRLKITLTHVIAIGVVLGLAHLFVGNVTEGIDKNTELSLRRAAVVSEQKTRLDHYALAEKASIAAQDSRLHEYMTVTREKLITKIQDNNIKLPLGHIAESKKKKVEAKENEGESSRAELLSTSNLRHFAAWVRLKTASYILDSKAKDIPEGTRNIGRSLVTRKPLKPDLAAVVDSNGRAVAALGKGNYGWGTDGSSPDVAKKHRSVMGVINNPKQGASLEVWSWRWSENKSPSLYQVAVLPIHPDYGSGDLDGSAAGAVIMGYQIHDGTAEKIQKLVGDISDGRMKESELRVEDLHDVAFFHGKSFNSSTFDSEQRKQLTKTLFEERKILDEDNPQKKVEFTMNSEPQIGFVRFLPDQFGTDDPAGVVVVSNLAKEREAASAFMWRLDVVGALAALFGIGLMLFFYQTFIRPVSEIEETIEEVLAGKDDAEFVISREGTIFDSLVQGLNLMSAYLRGEELPGDEDLEDWGDLAGGPDAPGGGDEGGGGANPDVQGVQMPGMGGGADDEES